MNYVYCKLLSHDRMFYVYSKAPNIVYVKLIGEYPTHLPPGVSDSREVLFEDTYENIQLYELMQEKSRKRSKKIAELCKNAITRGE